jgi:iron(III) transport system ATP-binding protein
MTTISLQNVSRFFGNTAAVDSVTVSIPSGSLFFLLGPSGCGKTTLLRLISGLDIPSRGEIWFDNSDVSTIPIEKRNVGIVFQQYALWPHMTVEENIQFGLTQRRMEKRAITDRIQEVLALTQLGPLSKRLPSELSGGQQQRVALARALALKPAVLLFDEPLSNLDPHLRYEIREQLVELHRSMPTTMIYVTHDTEEALSMADEIAILNKGRIVQSGRPEVLFHQPQSEFVARFLGEVNIFDGIFVKTTKGIGCYFSKTTIELPEQFGALGVDAAGEPIRIAIRPSYLSYPADDEFGITGTIEKIVFTGPATRLVIRISSTHSLTALLPSYRCNGLSIGDSITVGYDPRTIARLRNTPSDESSKQL